MFDLKKDRLNYGALLSPPEGYSLERAIGTTYSLDLHALLALPIAMIYSKSMEGNFTYNRYDVLQAIRECSDKVDLFCQKGNIGISSNYNNLLVFMEGCITEVTLQQVNSAFHSKIWVLKYVKGKETIFRFIALSRNLTFNRSWDVSFYTDGTISKSKNPQSEKLSLFLKSLYDMTGQTLPETFIEEVEQVSFNLPEGFLHMEFFPIQNFTKEMDVLYNPMLQLKYDKVLAISPFMDNNFLSKLRKNCTKLTFLSRQEELDKMKAAGLKGVNYFVHNTNIVEGEERMDSEEDITRSQNIHAKMFVCDSGDHTDWILGSANATSPAVNDNVEMLVLLRTESKKHRLKAFKRYILKEENNFFIPYEPKEIEKDEEKERVEDLIRNFLFELSKLLITGRAESELTNENYQVIFNIPAQELGYPEFSLHCKLIHTDKSKKQHVELGMDSELVFQNVSIVNLSQYLVFYITHKQTGEEKSVVYKIDMDLPEEREDVIFNRIINNQDKFFQMLQFILQTEDPSSSVYINRKRGEEIGNSGSLGDALGLGSSVYESLLLAASRNPSRLKEIDKIVTSLEKHNKDIVLDFLPLWKVFKTFIHE